MNNIDTLLDQIKTYIEEEVKRQVEAQMNGDQTQGASDGVPVTAKYDENILFELEDLAKDQLDSGGFDDSSLQDLNDIVGSYSTYQADILENSNISARQTSSTNSLDELESMARNPISRIESTVPEMPDQINNATAQPSQILDTAPQAVATQPPTSGIQNAFNILKRVIKS